MHLSTASISHFVLLRVVHMRVASETQLVRDSLEWRRGQVGTCCYVFLSVVALVALTTFYAQPSTQTLTLAGTYDAISGLLHRYRHAASNPGPVITDKLAD